MGWNFRKSIKIAPGVKINLGKKSAGISVGGKYGGVSYNTKTGGKARVSAPGTGISYTTKLNNDKTFAPPDNSGTSSSNNGGTNNKKPKRGNCIWILLIPFICLLVYIFSEVILKLGWIAGIIWLIFFRRRMKNDAIKQKKYTIVISILSILSFLLFFRYNVEFVDENDVPPNTEISSEMISDTETSELEANSEVDSEITNTEVDSNIEQNSEFNSEIPVNNFKNEQSTTELSSEEVPVVTPPQDEPVESQTPSEEPIQEPEETTKVWVSQSGSKYHNDPDCSNMKNPTLITLEEAESRGKSPCKKCY